MKNFIIAITAITLISCNKENKVEAPAFDVTATTNTVKAKSEITFTLTGNPELISFYSGAILHDYDLKGSRIINTKVTMTFNSQILDGAQPDQFAVMVSSDFNGTYDLQNINAAHWTNINERMRLATADDNREFVPSGKVDVSDLVVANKPLYVGFKYITKPQTANGRYNLWRVESFLLSAVNEIDSTALLTQSGGGWKLAVSDNYEANRSTITGTRITLIGNATNKEVLTEAWAISKAVTTATQTNLGPDRPVAIKSVADAPLRTYTFVYDKPGNYTATFVGINANLGGEKKKIIQLPIVVTP